MKKRNRALVLTIALVALSATPACKKKGSGFVPIGANCSGTKLEEGAVLTANGFGGYDDASWGFSVYPDGRVVSGRATINVRAARVQKLEADFEATGASRIPQGCWEAVHRVSGARSRGSFVFRRGGGTYSVGWDSGSDMPPAVSAASDVEGTFWFQEARLLIDNKLAAMRDAGAFSDASSP